MIKLLVIEELDEKGLNILKIKNFFEITYIKSVIKEHELIKIISKYDSIIIRSSTKITKKIIKKASKLKLIAKAGIGIDNIDIKSANDKNILVVNAIKSNTISTAEYTFALILNLAKKISWAYESISSYEWNRKKFYGMELYNKILGIIGIGRIGYELCKRAKAFGMKIIACDPYISENKKKIINVPLVSLKNLCSNSDIISVHVPLNKNTFGLINKENIKLMKKSVLLINCSRGGIYIEKDIIDALNKNKIKGAAFDTFMEEPINKNNPLIKMQNVLCTPHIAALTKEAQINVSIEICQIVNDFFIYGKIKNIVN